MDFHGFKGMDLVEQVHILRLTNIQTFGNNISLVRLFSPMLNYAKRRLIVLTSRTIDQSNSSCHFCCHVY